MNTQVAGSNDRSVTSLRKKLQMAAAGGDAESAAFVQMFDSWIRRQKPHLVRAATGNESAWAYLWPPQS